MYFYPERRQKEKRRETEWENVLGAACTYLSIMVISLCKTWTLSGPTAPLFITVATSTQLTVIQDGFIQYVGTPVEPITHQMVECIQSQH